jgi:uncharacterized protein YceH (UPF0502 family)
MLRGSQTPGELKNRASRMFNFESLAQVDDVLQRLMNREHSLLVKLPKQTGTKEHRYAHLLSGMPNINQEPAEVETISEEENRIVKLEEQVEFIRQNLEALKSQFENFRKQLE